MNKEKIKKILENYSSKRKNKEKILVVCHGHKHGQKFLGSLLLDIKPEVDPDIVMNIWDKEKMSWMEDFFDKVIMPFCSLVNKYTGEQKYIDILKVFPGIWENLAMVTKEGGYILNNNLLHIYTNMLYRIKYSTLSEQEKMEIKNQISQKFNHTDFLIDFLSDDNVRLLKVKFL